MQDNDAYAPDFIPVVRRLEELYISYKQKYVMSVVGSEKNPDGVMYVPKDKDGRPMPITNAVLCKHMRRAFAICVFAGPLSSKFICFDVDDGKPETVHAVIDGLVDLGFHRERIYVSSSGGKGYHVEMFFSRVMYTEDLKTLYWAVIRRQGLNPKKVEFRPTFTQAIKLPLSVHRKTRRRCWFVDPVTLEPIERRDYILEIQQVDYDEALRLIYEHAIMYDEPYGEDDEEPAEKPMPERVMTAAEYGQLTTLDFPDMTEAGTRHDLMLKIAVMCRYLSKTRDECTAALDAWYRRQPPDLIGSDEADVEADIEAIAAWVWSDKFHMVDYAAQKASLTFGQPDIRILLAQPTKTRRRLMFLIMRGTAKYGKMQATQARLGEAIGVTNVAVMKAAKEMAAEGWIKIIKAKPKWHEDGAIRGRPSRYYISDRAAQWASATLGTFIGADNSVLNLTFLVDKVEVPNSEERTWRQDYEAVLRGFCSDDTLKSYLTAKELEELNNGYETGNGAGAA